MVNVNYLIRPDQLHCYINKMIKEPGNSFQSPALIQNHVRNVCHTAQ